METRSKSQATEKRRCAVNWQRTWLSCVSVLVFAEGRPASDDTGDLAEEISKQGGDGVACFLPTAYSKVWEERQEWKGNR